MWKLGILICGCAYACDLNSDGNTNIQDVLLSVNMALATSFCPLDQCDVGLVVKEVNGAFGQSCVLSDSAIPDVCRYVAELPSPLPVLDAIQVAYLTPIDWLKFCRIRRLEEGLKNLTVTAGKISVVCAGGARREWRMGTVPGYVTNAFLLEQQIEPVSIRGLKDCLGRQVFK